MNNEVEILKKEDIKNYIEFIKEVFEIDTEYSKIENLIKTSKILVIKEVGKIIASVTFEKRIEYIKSKTYYLISYLGVLKNYRREGYATLLFNELEKFAIKDKVDYLELTFGNQRKNAYFFYKDKGFKVKDSTVFVKFIDSNY